MSGLVAVNDSGDQLTEEEIVSTCLLLLVAGHETTVNLIGNAILAMLRDRRQWTALSQDPSRASAVVEETLRYDPPVQQLSRIALDDMTIGGTNVAKGDMMTLLVAAAHRDPAEFERPDVFDPDRVGLRHLGFGRGAHYCLGAAGPVGSQCGVVGGDGTLSRRATGRRTAVQAEPHPARSVDADGRGLVAVAARTPAGQVDHQRYGCGDGTGGFRIVVDADREFTGGLDRE